MTQGPKTAEFHPLGAWQVMWHGGQRLSCLLLTTPAGKSMNFAFPPEVAVELGRALVAQGEIALADKSPPLLKTN